MEQISERIELSERRCDSSVAETLSKQTERKRLLVSDHYRLTCYGLPIWKMALIGVVVSCTTVA